MNKSLKVGIIIAAIILLIIVGLYILQSYSGKKQVQTESNQTAANLPGQTTSGTANLPISYPQDNVLRVSNLNDTDQIKKTYDDYINQDYKAYRYYESDGISDSFAPSDKEANLVPIDIFLNLINANINSNVKTIAGKNYYGLFYCINEKKQKEYGIALDMSEADSAKTQANYASAENYMRQWEPYMLKDLHNILFPSTNLDENVLNQNVVFKDGQFRYTDVNLPAGKSSINYKIADSPLNLILISTSQQCIEKAIKMFDALD